MLKNYFKIAVRNLIKHKGYSFINISGLAIGIAACLLIFLYINDEVTFDKFHHNSDRIYRINSKVNFGGNERKIAATNKIEAAAYAESIPEIEAFARINNATLIVQKGEEYVRQFKGVYADPQIFDLFDFKLIHGDFKTALQSNFGIVITRSVAAKYFGKTDVVGKELRIKISGEPESYFVDAVIENFPSNSSLNFEVILPWSKTAKKGAITSRDWGNISNTSFIMIRKDADVNLVQQKMKEVRNLQNPGEDGEFARGIENFLQPLTAIHFTKGYNGGSAGIKKNSNPTHALTLGGIAILILALACINFANLTVARSLPRSKEIGVRKVLGAKRSQLTKQFLSEALFVSSISFILGLILAELFLPAFGELTNKQFSSSIIDNPVLLVLCLLLVLATALLAGVYPSFSISRFSTIDSLNGKLRLSNRRYVSKALVLFQFAIAGILVVGTVAINKQIGFMVNKDLGFDDSNLVYMDMFMFEDKASIIKTDLSSNPNLTGVALSNGYGSGSEYDFKGKKLLGISNIIDGDYMDLKGLEVIEGRRLIGGGDYTYRGTDTLSNVIVNEMFIKEMGIEEPLNTTLGDGSGNEVFRIVGVVKDYDFATARSKISPLVLFSGKSTGEYAEVLVRYRSGYDSLIQDELLKSWRKIEPYQPLSFKFLEEENQNAFAEEERWKSIITNASFLTIFISCLGLFGLAHLSAEQRKKEIGVRKVLGASVQNLLLLLNAGFSKLVLLSFIIVVPVAYFLVNTWLQSFPYRIEIGVGLFLLPAIITFGIAFLTVSFQSLKTANANPVDSLRNE